MCVLLGEGGGWIRWLCQCVDDCAERLLCSDRCLMMIDGVGIVLFRWWLVLMCEYVTQTIFTKILLGNSNHLIYGVHRTSWLIGKYVEIHRDEQNDLPSQSAFVVLNCQQSAQIKQSEKEYELNNFVRKVPDVTKRREKSKSKGTCQGLTQRSALLLESHYS